MLLRLKIETGWLPKSCTSLKKLYERQTPKKILCHLTSVILCSLFLICGPSKLGQIGCHKMSVRNYHSTLHNIPEEHRSHVMIWDAGLGLALHSPVQSDSVWCFVTQILDDLTYLSAKFQEKSTSCIQVNMVISSVWGRRSVFYVPVTPSQYTHCNCDESADIPVPKCFMIRDERMCHAGSCQSFRWKLCVYFSCQLPISRSCTLPMPPSLFASRTLTKMQGTVASMIVWGCTNDC